ncbi:uncharacterized protein IUM83_16812 [Phytophthora cinnamomi]|uniref:uncharacterized protein n=1 Tax=Phytophthora cinnamomi TaxID=4785 RepID=UPI0035595516|nr:hypothetical protein IUM83_16812 [Phytophthora cinnamomi]
MKAEEDCHILHVTPPTDNGASLAQWLEVLKATTVEVAANGHCGWLAFHAALYNLNMGLVNISNEVAEGANILKKRVLNSMIANIVEEMQLHPQELTIELNAGGYHQEANGSYEEQICALVNHLVAQRDKSVKAKIPMHFWVRPAHIKAMAQFARETIYVLDVHEDGQAWIEAYAYNEVKDAKGKPVEIGNHFQAVHYPQELHGHYAENIATLAKVRNDILMEHGWKALDQLRTMKTSQQRTLPKSSKP